MAKMIAPALPPVDISHEYAHTINGNDSPGGTCAPESFREASMVVDLKKLSDSLRRSAPKDDLRRDLERIIHARKDEIEQALAQKGTYLLRVPDGRQLRISRKPQPAEAAV